MPMDPSAVYDLNWANINDLEHDVSDFSDESANRSAGTWESNGTEYPLLVYVQVDGDGSAASIAQVDVHVNTDETDNNVLTDKAQACDSANSATVSASASFVVPPGNSYKVAISDANASIGAWQEQKLGAP